MNFISRWLADAIRLALALSAALLAMQIPALTHEALAGLQQVATATRHDIDQREDAVRLRYHLTADTDAGLIAALRPLEPANADSLDISVARSRSVQLAAERIGTSAPLLQPITAAREWLSDRSGALQPVLDAALAGFVPQIVLGSAAAIYGIGGLLLGSLLAHLLLAALAGRRQGAGAVYR